MPCRRGLAQKAGMVGSIRVMRRVSGVGRAWPKRQHVRGLLQPRLVGEHDGTFALTVNIDPDTDAEGSKMLDLDAVSHR